MWNNVAEFIKDSSTKRLALAIVVSVALHAYLVGSFSVHLPSIKKEIRTIEARLQMPKMAVKKAVLNEQTQPVALPQSVEPATAAPSQQQVESTPKVLDSATPEQIVSNINPSPTETLQSESDDLAQAVPQPAELQSNELQPTELQPNELQLAEPESSELQPIDERLVINENAYQYVETDFDVRTEIDGATAGSAKIVFNLINGTQYQLTSLIKPRGLAALIISDLLQTSEGQLNNTGLQPANYRYQYGNKVDKTYVAKFDWANKTVNLTTSKGTKTETITDGTQDLLSFMYQFMYVAPLERMQINIATGKKLTNYDYRFAGEENINSALGELKTLHIFHESENSDEKTELWLALDYQFLPVKIRKTEKNGKVYELVANRINTTRPTLN